jgi:hypothetical protein
MKTKDAYLIRRGKRIALDVITVEPQFASRSSKPPRLRFDRVVLELFDRLRVGLKEAIPAGTTVFVTVTAPVRLSGKTAVEIVERSRALLAARGVGGELRVDAHGNQIRIHILRRGSTSAPKVVGFVHNRDSDPSPLFDLTRVLLRGIAVVVRKRTPRRIRSWLVVLIEDEPAWIKTYGHVCSQLVAGSEFERVVLVNRQAEQASSIAADLLRWGVAGGSDRLVVRRGQVLQAARARHGCRSA